MCTVLLPPGVNPIAVNKYIIPYHIITYHIISYHIVSYHIMYHTTVSNQQRTQDRSSHNVTGHFVQL